VTDGILKNEQTQSVVFPTPVQSIMPMLKPYSVNTFKIVLKKEAATAIENKQIPPLSILPNPASDFIKIDGFETPYTFLIYDSVGKLKQVKKDNIDTIYWNIRELPSGFYFVVLDNSVEKKVGKFIKN
jgi:hypothetical protein